MKNLSTIFPVLMLFSIAISACSPKEATADAYGNFEATEVVVSAESPGKLLLFDVQEGEVIPAGKSIALVDTMPLHLQKAQALAEKEAVGSQTQGVFAQIAVTNEQIAVLDIERQRLQKLVKDSAATPQALDEIDGKLRVARQQKRSIESQNTPVVSKMNAIDQQIRMIDDRIARCRVTNPTRGTVLYKLAEPGEMVAAGKPLYRIAPLDELYLRAYLSGDQLGKAKLGQQVGVTIDGEDGELIELKGKISWIAQTAEFTPKIVQTRATRTNLVYAFKVRVKNDGRLKIGMPGEVMLDPNAAKDVAQSEKL
jgi:HlyD family secretion protein